jgi:hypothetical protein
MGYTKTQFEDAVERFGEVFFVLDSDREYEVHGKEGYKISDDSGVVRIEGMQDGEYLVVEFNLYDIEHHYTHREV